MIDLKMLPMKWHVVVALMIGVVALIIYAGENVATTNGKTLKLVHIIFRHGIRTPADTYPNDPYINDDLYPVGWGQITNEGKQQLYEHGRYLRNRYGAFLGDHYTPSEYYVQTTDVDRTKVSAQCINAGLWPPNAAQKWGALDWQPIPSNSEPLNQDDLLLVRRPCPKYHKELQRVINTTEISNRLRASQTLFADLTKHTGKRVKDFEDVQDIFTTLMSEEAYGLKLPPWTAEFYPKRILNATVFSYVLNAYNNNLNRLKGGVLVKKLIADWTAATSGGKRKASLFIGHDSTIVNLLSALKIWEPQLPGFAINVLFELSHNGTRDEYGVEIFLRNSTNVWDEPHRLTIPGCETFCPLPKLIELTKEVVPDDWDEECKIADAGYIPPTLRGP
uniref:Acid phosphatase n=1 Tax=Photinus pyralis TaxID=7054 RepID=A0A1Y1N7Z4_PHOPY